MCGAVFGSAELHAEARAPLEQAGVIYVVGRAMVDDKPSDALVTFHESDSKCRQPA